MLFLDEYQRYASRTANNSDFKNALVNYALGLTGESGEVAEVVKKHIFHGHKIDRKDIEKELGDVLWYVSNIALLLNINLSDVAETNIDKLMQRYPEGFSKSDSINRKES